MTDMPSSRRVNVSGLLFCTRGPEFHLNGHFEYTSKSNTEFQESFMSLCMIFYVSFCISQFYLRPASPLPPPPRATAARNFPALSVPGVGHLQILLFCTARAPGICQPWGHSRAFNTHAVSYQNITTQRVIKACSRFYAWISSLLIKPKLHSEIGAIDVNQRSQFG